MGRINPAYLLAGLLFAAMVLIHLTEYQGTRGEISEDNLANFPPPDKYEEIGGEQATLTLINASRDALQVTLQTDDERLTLNLAGCPECAPVPEGGEAKCETAAVQESWLIPPGTYEVKATFIGPQRTQGFLSDWTIEGGWNYSQCLYTSAEFTY